MKIPFSLDVVIPKIVEFGLARVPNEACGLVIPNLDNPVDTWVHELINRSPSPQDSYIFDAEAMKPLLTDQEVWSDVLVWHTHPSGRIGPSQGDMEARHPALHGRYLVVALPHGEATLF